MQQQNVTTSYHQPMSGYGGICQQCNRKDQCRQPNAIQGKLTKYTNGVEKCLNQ